MSATTTGPFRGDTDDVIGTTRADLTTPARTPLQRLLATDASAAATIGRLGLGLVMLPHALQKNFGLFGGMGFSGTYAAFTQNGMPGVIAFLVIVGELLASLGLIFGALTRVSALGVAAIMLGAIALVHAPNGFFMNWYGHKAGEGFEFHILAIALALAIAVLGGGWASIDRFLARWRPAAGGRVSPVMTDG